MTDARVGLIMGSDSDWPVMEAAATALAEFDVPFEIGVPVPLGTLDGMDSLLSIVQMPAGVPVACVSIGGARNAGLLAVRILAAADADLGARMEAFQAGLDAEVQAKDHALRARLLGE